MIKLCFIWLCLSVSIVAELNKTLLSFDQLAGWDQADVRPVMSHFLYQAAPKQPGKQWTKLTTNLEQVDINNNQAVKAFIETYFQPIKVTDSTYKPRITGYHIYTVNASRKQSTTYNVPIYRNPKLKGLNSDLTHADIINGGLANNNLELAWLPSHLDVYLLMMQGSGCLLYPDGSRQPVVYAGSNGHGYQSISDYMIKQGYITEAQRTGPFVKLFLQQHPQLAQHILKQNPSYVFFKTKDSFNYVGAAGTLLAPYLSVAVDKSFYSLPSFLWLDTEVPIISKKGSPQLIKFQQLVIAQDTGGAIKGPQRADLYFGLLPQAETLAGLMNYVDGSLIYFKLK